MTVKEKIVKWITQSGFEIIFLSCSRFEFGFEEFCLLTPERIHALHPLDYFPMETRLWRPLNGAGATALENMSGGVYLVDQKKAFEARWEVA